MQIDSTKKILGFKDIALLTFIANFGVRWLAVAAGIGASSVFFWIVGAIILAFPMAYMCAQLSRLYPEEGGIYAWTRNVMGEKSGFIVAWMYFVNNLFYYPAVLIFLATCFAYFLGEPALANNSVFICVVVLIAFWLVVLISIFGLKFNKIMAEFGGFFGSVVPALLIIGLGFGAYIWTKHSATTFTLSSIIPDHHISSSLSNLTMLMFAMTGVEIIPTFANAVKNPKKDLYFGLLLGAVLMIVFYVLGTIAMSIIVSHDDIHKASGLMHAFEIIFATLHIPWMTRGVALMLVFAELGVVSIWLVAPITMFFKCTPIGLLPDWFHKTNKSDAPVNAILFVGLVVTVIVLTTNLLPAVNDMYQILILMSVLLTFIPYLFLVNVFIKSMRKFSGNQLIHLIFSGCVIISLLLGIIFSFELPTNIVTLQSKILYELEMFFGPLIFILAGYFIYHRGQKNRL